METEMQQPVYEVVFQGEDGLLKASIWQRWDRIWGTLYSVSFHRCRSEETDEWDPALRFDFGELSAMSGLARYVEDWIMAHYSSNRGANDA